MSTDLKRDPGGDRPIGSEEELEAWFAAGCRPPSRWGLGLEYERLGVDRTTGQAIPFHGPASVRALFETLGRQGWEPHLEDGEPIALTRGDTHITLEPGGQTELSGSIHSSLEAMQGELCSYLQELAAASDPMEIAWLGVGLQPFSSRESIAWVPKARYGLMSAHLGRTGRLAHDMMKRTAGIQVNFDFESEEDAALKFRAMMGAAPLITALFANSPLAEGKPTGSMSTRAAIWRETDPARCGLLRFAFEDRPLFRTYLDWALDVPMMFVVRDGRWMGVNVPFRQFLRDGFQGLAATLADWQLHVTTLFPDVRLKRFMEARCADSGDAALAMAQVALIKGIVYDARATREVAALTTGLGWKTLETLHADVARDGLAARVKGRPVLDLAARLVEVARDGLIRSGAGPGLDESGFLRPVEIILQDAESPARRLLRLWEGAMDRSPAALVAHLSRVNLQCYGQ